ncbi:RluA family pseudouridine synthase [Microbulbifer thermotolerans]|uniref:Pseudouridine synthase n=1 Tax=Microbulbifer thermotolerans TaxID=252514 RepID=A0A143HQ79_MICTH|nr:RluA family pseudouridine synthase [Microbulbifer thermotolerans]AMX03661.1 RNA pseudouridine synthase [Microbulbifer thermotolerans]MCX2780931.1 RluA family pseudouridine synthase [Microbulbifer thermotolerans]MCX2782084.1 RluA family pseudouridine synthase [Microbulbifer thermotolerans]MCX2796215.1 RluA family pseudouridine synthase [Microbulbifer thermotolerans]MCX2802556.1 RluA family pseudouridine synthase [Microbulbifer thermotolerans]
MRAYRPPAEPFLSVVYEDEALLVLDKPSGLLSVPGRDPAHRDSLASRAQARYPGALTVHRLDMDTSGLVVMARNPQAHRKLSAQFQNRQVEKVYCAKVWGELADNSGEIDLPLICDWPNRPRQKVDFELGKPSLTRWEKISACAGFSLVCLRPVTGRSHQLRVHLQAIDHPILGDPFYAHPQARTAAPRLLLHATELAFTHPESGEQLRFSSAPETQFF